jgi:hypothetical protein
VGWNKYGEKESLCFVKAENDGRKSNDVGSESAKLPLHDSDSAGSGIAKSSKGTSYLRAVLARLLNSLQSAFCNS